MIKEHPSLLEYLLPSRTQLHKQGPEKSVTQQASTAWGNACYCC
uniref:Uncharacterized protein n=1 Tax=Pan troglodytes TaxID=9598 RepID=G2HG87_PANTR|nr:hypothetical protein [Pan troglodytes]